MKAILYTLCLFFPLMLLGQNPVANDDYYTVTPYYQNYHFFNVLNNDSNISGDDYIIYEITPALNGTADFVNDTLIRYWQWSPWFPVDSLKYRISLKNDPLVISNWATVVIEFSLDSANLVTGVNDYAQALAGWPVTVNVIKNDINLSTDSIVTGYPTATNGKVITTDSSIIYTPKMSHKGGKDTLVYTIKSRNMGNVLGYASLIVDVENNHSYDSVNINNINAGVESVGLLFSNHQYTMDDYRPHFEVPKGSGMHTIFTSSLWVGGLHNSELHLSGERYRQVGVDYHSGPISYVYDSIYHRKFARAWKVSTDDIAYHIAHVNDPQYEPVEAIRNWPGNGDVSLGQAEQLAPFCDYNNNGVYEPLEGDYPLIRGDQAVYFIYNDQKEPNTESEGKRLGVEIHAMVYAFDRPDDSTIFNTVFVHFDIINRSDRKYDSTFVGIWSDMDIGHPNDDFTGSNVELGYYYCYNGDDFDENDDEEQAGYENHPPAQSATFLAGPEMDADGIDNPADLCDYSANGLNFGDNIIDNERLGMTGFLYHHNGSGIFGTPVSAEAYYNYLTRKWQDSTHMMFGGYGHPLTGSTNLPANFIFPWNSDTCNWGTNGIEVPEESWNEFTTGGEPYDRRGLGSSGPFTFEAGEKVELDMAFVFARDFDGDNIDALDILEERNRYLKERVRNGELIYLLECSPASVEENQRESTGFIYPNPAKDHIFIQTNSIGKVQIEIFDLTGKLRYTGKISNHQKLQLDFLEKGFYFVRMRVDGNSKTAKLIKL